MKKQLEILSLFHHIHHNDSRHEVHHCGGKHAKINPKLDYSIKHCFCGKHSINKSRAIGHAVDIKMNLIELEIIFNEKCPHGGWHLESGKKTGL